MNRFASFLRVCMTIVLLAGSAIQTQTVYAASLPAEINKQFTPLQITTGGVSVMRVTIFNPNVYQLTNASWADNLVGVQPGLFIANPSGVVNTCGGTATAVSGTTNLSLSGGTVPPQVGSIPGECYVEVNVSSVTQGNLINTIPANNLISQGDDGGTIVNITNTTPASATITVIAVTPPSLTKGFVPNTIFVGQISRLTITLNNNDNSVNLTGTSYADTLPTGVVLANSVNAVETNCGASSLIANPGANTITISSATVTPNLNCVVAVDVTGASGVYTNTIPAGSGGPGSIQTDQGVTNNTPASANLNIQPVGVLKSFNPVNFQAGGTTTLTITLQNPTGSAYTGVGISDTLPGVFLIATPANITNTCGGSVTATSGTKPISLAGGTIPASGTPPTPPGTCTITVQVTAPVASTASTSTNTIPANTLIADQPGVTNVISATANISVYATGTGVGGVKSFSQATIDPGQNTRLRIDLTAPTDTNLTNFSITDNLPSGVTISNSTVASKSANCIGGVLSAPTGGTTITWTGGTINAGQLCRIDVYVTSSTSGTVTNTITPANISNNENRAPANNITSNLTVRTLSDLTVRKAFYPAQVVPGGISTLTITLQNVNALPLINVSATDSLATMGTGTNTVRIAPVPNASTTCGGALVAVTGTQNISLTGGTIPAQVGAIPGICTITVNVQAGTNLSTRTNTLPLTNVSGEIQGTGTTINALSDATANLQVLNLTIGVVKGFNPVLVYGGASSTLSVQLINPNNTALVGIAFTDDMTLLGTGMVVANPANLNVGTCGGVLVGNPGDTSYSFSGGTLPPNTSCTVTLRVTMTVNGNLTNRIPAGAVTTLNGVSSQFPTEASLTNLPGVSVNKAFNPSQVLTGQASTLTISIKNTSLVPVVNMGVADGLPGALPNGLEVANPANATNTCGGSLTATPGAQNIQLVGGGLAGNASCAIAVDVISTQPGTYINTIPVGALTANGGVTNNDATTDTLTVNSGTFSLGNRVWFDTDNSGTINGSEVGVDSVTVQLYAADAGGAPTGAVLATAPTANGGYYRFDNLPAGDYVVVIPATQFTGSGALAGYWSSRTTISGGGVISETAAPNPNNDIDNDDNGTRQLSGAVISGAITLGPSANEPTNDTDADSTNPPGEAPNAQSNRTVDFGFYREQVGNLVFVDVNVNGTYDAGDTLLSGATVQLYASNGTTEINVGPDGILGTTDDAPGGVTTSAGGTYLFSGLPAGDYIVKVTPPTGYVSTVDTADAADTVNPNTHTDNNDNGIGTATGIVNSGVLTMTPGVAATNITVSNATGTTTNPTIDFGFAPLLPPTGLVKSLSGSNQTFTADPNVAIGEIVTSQLSVTIPPGTYATAQVVDTMDRGLSFVDCTGIIDNGLTTSVAGSFTSICSTPTVDDAGGGTTTDVGRRVTFNFGTLTNGTGSDKTLVITYRAVVLDSAANISGTNLNNTATFLWTGGSLGPSSTTVKIVESHVGISKTANKTLVAVGSEITITLEIQHDTNSKTDAFETSVTDVLPVAMDFVPGSLECASGAQNADTCTYDTITRTVTAVWNTFTLSGGNGRVTFRVRILTVPSAGISNTANVLWTSLPGFVNTPQNSNIFSTERGYDPASQINVYGSSSTLKFNVATQQLPATGFAPNIVTDLSNTPQETYSAENGISVVIPSLGINIPIVGVPLKDGTWNVAWLSNQAGWLEGSAFPSWDGNSVLTGHVYLSNGKPGPFVNLSNLKYGDLVVIHAYGEKYIFAVQTNAVVKPNNKSILKHEEKPWLTLITCKDYDERTNSYRNRTVVRAILVNVSSEK